MRCFPLLDQCAGQRCNIFPFCTSSSPAAKFARISRQLPSEPSPRAHTRTIKICPQKGNLYKFCQESRARLRDKEQGRPRLNGHWITPGALSYIMYSRTLWILWHKTDTLLPLLGCCAITAYTRRHSGASTQNRRLVGEQPLKACECVFVRELPGSFIAHRKRETRTPLVSMRQGPSRLFKCTKDPCECKRCFLQIYQAAQDLNFNRGAN